MYEAMKCDTVRMRMAIDISVVLIFGNGGLGLASIDGAVELKSGSNRDVIIRNPIVMHSATVSHSDSDSHLTRC